MISLSMDLSHMFIMHTGQSGIICMSQYHPVFYLDILTLCSRICMKLCNKLSIISQFKPVSCTGFKDVLHIQIIIRCMLFSNFFWSSDVKC